MNFLFIIVFLFSLTDSFYAAWNCCTGRDRAQWKMHNANQSRHPHYARRYMSNRMIHVQQSFRWFARALNKFWLVESWFLNIQGPAAADTSHSRTIFDQSDARRYHVSWIQIGRNHSIVRCICCHRTLYPKINFQPIRTCLTHTQFRGMAVGHVSFRWTCIALHSGSLKKIKKKRLLFLS